MVIFLFEATHNVVRYGTKPVTTQGHAFFSEDCYCVCGENHRISSPMST